MNFAIIGTNFVTDWLLEAGRLHPEFTLTAVYSRTMERAKEYSGKYRARHAFDSLADLCLCDEVDAVYIASPTACHYKQAVGLMRAGKHILCEKPIASNTAELESMLKLSRENNVVLLEAMRPEFSPTLETIQTALESLGKIRHVAISYCKYSSRYDRFLAGEPVNAFNPALSNGALTDLGCYCIHVLTRLFGKPQNIQSSAVKLANGIDAAGSFLACYEGMTAVIYYSKVSDTHNYCEIQGEQGTLQFRDPVSMKEVYLIKREQAQQRIASPAAGQDMFYELQAFIDFVKKAAAPLPPGGSSPPSATNSWSEHPRNGLEVHQRHSLDTMRIMDEVRRQCGIVFPADRNKTIE